MSFGYREINLITEDGVNLLKKLMGEEAFIKMRDFTYYELLQNADSKVFMTHSDVFQKVMAELNNFAQKDKYYNLPAEDVFKYFKTFLERADEISYTLNYTYSEFTLTDEQSITQFYETLLKPLVEKINLGPAGPQIDVEKIKFGRTDSFDDLIEYLTKSENITIGDLATIDEQIVDNIVGLLAGDLQALELGQMYTAVPGTEGTRPLVNIVTTIYESIDELDNDHLYELSQWADSFLTLDGVDNVGNVDDWLFAGSSRQAHLKEKIEQYLNDIFDYGQQYKKGEVLDTNPLLNEDHWYRGKLQRGAGARFGKIFIGEKSDLPWDILLKNSPDPVGFLASLNPDIEGNRLLSEGIFMAISGKTLTSAAGITGEPEIVNGMFDTNFFAERFEDWSIDDIIEKYFMSPIMDNQGYGSPSQFTDEDIFYINEIKKKFTPYNKISMGVLLEGSPGSQEEKLLEIEKSNQLLRQGASELKEDLVLYHSRPVDAGALPLDANFHAGTYQAALDRAAIRYQGQSMYKMAADTFDDLNFEINEEMKNITLGEDYSSTVTAQFGIGDNETSITAEIIWDANNEEVNIQLADNEGYLTRYPEYSEGISLEEYGLTTENTLSDAVGDIAMEEYVDIDEFVKNTPMGVSDEFQWQRGYDLYEVRLQKGANILNLNQTIMVEQKGREVPLSGDRLQEAVEKGLNQPGSDSVYQGIEAINIGDRRVEIPDNASADEISELIFGEYDAIAYVNDIEDAGSISYVVKPEVAKVARQASNANRLFNMRVAETFIKENPFLFTGSYMGNDRKIRNILNIISDTDRRGDMAALLNAYNVAAQGRSPETIGDAYDEVQFIKNQLDTRGDITRIIEDDFEGPSALKPEIIEFSPSEKDGFQKAIGQANSYISNEIDKVDKLKDVYVVTPEQLSEAIDLMKDANEGEIFETHNQLISELKEYLYQDLGFNASAEGAMADLDTVLDDWLTRQGTFEDTKFFNNFPKIENLPDPKNVRGLVAAAGGPENIKTDYVIPQYFKDKPNVTYVDEIDTVEEAITKSDGIDNLNKSKEIINKNPRIFSKILSVLEKFDVGDQVIQQVIKRALPRIGMSAATGPAALAYAAYEVSLLVADAVNATYKAETTSESFWDNFGEISDKYSIAYKITKPAYDMLFDAVKVDLEDDNTLYSFSR